MSFFSRFHDEIFDRARKNSELLDILCEVCSMSWSTLHICYAKFEISLLKTFFFLQNIFSFEKFGAGGFTPIKATEAARS